MKRIFIYSLIAGLFFLSGCEEFLTTTPQDFVTPQTYFNKPEDAELALNAAYVNLKNIWFLGGRWLARTVADTDDAYSILEGMYPANHRPDATEAAFANHWNVVYQTIERCNVVLANLDRIDMDETNREVIRGEALFLRGYCFFFFSKPVGACTAKIRGDD